jgi:hypothetical protein
LSEAVASQQASPSVVCLSSPRTINLGFLTKGKLAAILITPSSWGSQRAGHSPRISATMVPSHWYEGARTPSCSRVTKNPKPEKAHLGRDGPKIMSASAKGLSSPRPSLYGCTCRRDLQHLVATPHAIVAKESSPPCDGEGPTTTLGQASHTYTSGGSGREGRGSDRLLSGGAIAPPVSPSVGDATS